MSEIYDIDMPTEPGLYESIHFPIGPKNGYSPYRFTPEVGLQMRPKDGRLSNPINREDAIRNLGPYRLLGLDAEIDFEDGAEYWVTFKDDSRVRMKARRDKHGDIDMENDLLEFGFWSGRKGEPTNRDNIKSIHKINEGGA